jgi:hypothetical protein
MKFMPGGMALTAELGEINFVRIFVIRRAPATMREPSSGRLNATVGAT